MKRIALALEKNYFKILFLLALLVHFYHSTLGWSFPLADPHGFRQAQNAVTAYYFVKEGLKLNYETPVLGKPWSIPMDFPLYQAIVAVIVKSTHLNLVQVGRFVSLIFFYLFLSLVYLTQKQLKINRKYLLIIPAIILISPVYLYWPRTFMIESLALCLSLFYFYLILKFKNYPIPLLAILTISIGSIAGAVKITTFILFLIPALVVLFSGFRNKKRLFFLNIFLLIIIPITVSLGWVKYADHVKAQNPIAYELLTSRAQQEWNFGTLDQRLNPQTWLAILYHLETTVIGSKWLFIPILAVFILSLTKKSNKYKNIMGFSLLSFLLALALFTNLYMVHNYYHYANAVFLLVLLGLLLIWLIEIKKLKLVVKFIILPAVLIFLYQTYSRNYLPYQLQPNFSNVSIGDLIRNNTAENDVVLIYGFTWSPEIPFYAQRKALMDLDGLSIYHPKMQKSIALTGKDNIRAMFIRGHNWDFVFEKVNYFGFDPAPIEHPAGLFYVKKK